MCCDSHQPVGKTQRQYRWTTSSHERTSSARGDEKTKRGMEKSNETFLGKTRKRNYGVRWIGLEAVCEKFGFLSTQSLSFFTIHLRWFRKEILRNQR